ncbi:hypothetical protein [Streptosporangium sp. 'caverna']|uniref:hypothetical protein n=1 Tax=Streptosporangium sp. 'caverna' TaxID=2202249 RepID=UPI0013A696D8|nr:hypothetical protein [Streptosporangium sp. 'caverna']
MSDGADLDSAWGVCWARTAVARSRSSHSEVRSAGVVSDTGQADYAIQFGYDQLVSRRRSTGPYLVPAFLGPEVGIDDLGAVVSVR